MTILVSCTLEDGGMTLRRYDSRLDWGLTHIGCYHEIDLVVPADIDEFRRRPPDQCRVAYREPEPLGAA